MNFSRYERVVKLSEEYPWFSDSIRRGADKKELFKDIFDVKDVMENLDTFIEKYDFNKDLLCISRETEHCFDGYHYRWESRICNSTPVSLSNTVEFISTFYSSFCALTLEEAFFKLKFMEKASNYGTLKSFFNTINSEILKLIKLYDIEMLITNRIFDKIIAYTEPTNNKLFNSSRISLPLADELKNSLKFGIFAFFKDKINLAQSTYTQDEIDKLKSLILSDRQLNNFLKSYDCDISSVAMISFNPNAAADTVKNMAENITDTDQLQTYINDILSHYGNNDKVSAEYIVRFIKHCIIENGCIKDRKDKIMKRNAVHNFIDQLIYRNNDKCSGSVIRENILNGNFDTLFTNMEDYFYDPYYIFSYITTPAYMSKRNNQSVSLTVALIQRLILLNKDKFVKQCIEFVKEPLNFPKFCSKKVNAIPRFENIIIELTKADPIVSENYKPTSNDNFDVETEIIKLLTLRKTNESQEYEILKDHDSTYGLRSSYDGRILSAFIDSYDRKPMSAYAANYLLTGNIEFNIVERFYNTSAYYTLQNCYKLENSEKLDFCKNAIKLMFAYILGSVKSKYTNEQLEEITKYVENKCGNDIILYNSYWSQNVSSMSDSRGVNEYCQIKYMDINHLQYLSCFCKLLYSLKIFNNISLPEDTVLVPTAECVTKSMTTDEFEVKYFGHEPIMYNLIKSVLPKSDSEISMSNYTDSLSVAVESAASRLYGSDIFNLKRRIIRPSIINDSYQSDYDPCALLKENVCRGMFEAYTILLNVMYNTGIITEDEINDYKESFETITTSLECNVMLS